MKKELYSNLALLTILSSAPLLTAAEPTISLSKLSSIKTGVFDESAAEIVAYDEVTKKLFI